MPSSHPRPSTSGAATPDDPAPAALRGPGAATWLRERPTSTQVRNDLALGVLLVALSLLYVELMRSIPRGGSPLQAHLAESYLWAAIMSAPLTVRRLLPVPVMLVCAAAFFGLGVRVGALLTSPVVQVSLFIAIYTAWAWSRHRRRMVGSSVVVLLGMFGWVLWQLATTDLPRDSASPGVVPGTVAVAVVTLGINIVYFFGAIAWGLVSHRNARQRDALREQAAALRREQERNAERAVADERLRIARDLHDAVAHHVSGVGVQAAAARHVLDRDPQSSRQALEAIEQSSRAAVKEMHQIVGLLRDQPVAGAEDAAGDPGGQPSLAALPTLVQSASTEGFCVRLREVGNAVPVPETVGSSLYRVAQEALANTQRHSTARQADVVVRYGTGATGSVEVEILDDGAPRLDASGGETRSGFGLQGIRERVALHQGETDIGPRPGGGFRVRARVPLAGEAS